MTNQYRVYPLFYPLVKKIMSIVISTFFLTITSGSITGQNIKSFNQVCSDTLRMSDVILNQKDTVFFEIPDTGFYKNVFIVWDEYPEFPSGEEGFIKYLKENTFYPKSALKDSIEGKVHLLFAIDIDGCPRDIKVMDGIRNDLNSECIRVLRKMPKWKPSTSIRKADKGWYRTVVKMYYHVLFNFSLSKNSDSKGVIIYPK